MNRFVHLIVAEGIAGFAARIAAKPRTVYAWRRGDRAPRPEAARRIVRAFPGRITMDDIYGDRGRSRGARRK